RAPPVQVDLEGSCSVHEQIAANKRKTFLLIVLAIAFLSAIGWIIGYFFLYGGTPGLIIAAILAIALSLGSYFYGDKVVLRSTGAKKVTPEQEPRLHNVVE